MKRIHLFLVLLVGVILTSCKNDDDAPAPVNEEETITTVKLTVTETGTNNTQTYIWKDETADKITLKANAAYQASVQFLDESDPSDAEDITLEVVEEKDEHFVFYTTTASGVSFASASGDTIDSDKVGINIKTDWTIGDAATGKITVYLIHEPTTKTGTTRDAFGGETDIEVSFDVEIK